jgi:hypothetical protein
MGPACSVFRSALMVPFSWEGEDGTARAWLEEFRTRRLPSRRADKGEVLLWEERPAGGGLADLRELNPTFRQILGLDDSGREESYPSPWRCGRFDLQLTRTARERLFRAPRLWFGRGPGRRCIASPSLDRVELLLFPLGGGLLVFHLDWLPAGGSTSAADVALVLYTARHFLQEDRTPGWTFARPGGLRGPSAPPAPGPSEEYHRALGDAMFEACHGSTPVALETLAQWLLRPPDDAGNSTRPRITTVRQVLHHTAVLLTCTPSEGDLGDMGFRFRRACLPDSLPPPPGPGNDVVLRTRANRAISLAREGSVSISWAPPESNQLFEREVWPLLFQRIFLQLALQVQGERMGLTFLAARASGLGGEFLPADSQGRPFILDNPAQHRDRLLRLWLQMSQYTLTLSPEDCGGPTEYVEFFNASRQVHGMPGQLAELRQELTEVTTLMETLHRAVQHRAIEEERQRAEAAANALAEERIAAQRRFQAEQDAREREREAALERFRKEQVAREEEREIARRRIETERDAREEERSAAQRRFEDEQTARDREREAALERFRKEQAARAEESKAAADRFLAEQAARAAESGAAADRFRAEQAARAAEQDHERRLERMLAVMGVVALPAALVSGLWGINNAQNLPASFPELGFLTTLGVIVAATIAVGAVFWLLHRRSHPVRGSGPR